MDIDLKPALSKEQLDARILRDFDEAKNKQFKNSLNHLIPGKADPGDDKEERHRSGKTGQ